MKRPLADLLSDLVRPGPGSESIERVLHAVRAHLGMDVAFITEFGAGHRVFRHVDAAGNGAPVQVGDSSPLEKGYCQRVIDGRLPELIPDTSAVPAAMEIPETRTMGIGAHLSVPIRLRSGELYGTFCCFSYAPDPSLDERDLQVMRAFAELAAHQIDLDVERTRTTNEKAARVSDVLELDRMQIVYQPIYKLDVRGIVGFEALARFPVLREQPPNVLFAEAADVGMGTELELAVVRKALKALDVLPSDIYIGLNVSPATVLSGNLEPILSSLPGERIVLKITEHAKIPSYGELVAALEPLRRRSCQLAVDDAGAGYAGLQHILNLRPDLIKLDMTLTRSIDSDPAKRALAAALIGFARETGCRIIAEGVETEAELVSLRLLGVNKAQGYFLGRPMPIENAAALIKEPNYLTGTR